MADNSTVKDASGASQTIASDERTIATVPAKVQRVVDQGGTAIAADDVAVTTTAAQAIAARETRKLVEIFASEDNTDDIYIGASGVSAHASTPANGIKMPPGSTLPLETTAAIYADSVGGTQTLYYIEVYDS